MKLRSLIVAFSISSIGILVAACDDSPKPGSKESGEPSAKPSATASAPSTPTVDSTPAKTAISIFLEEKRLTVGSDKIDLTTGDPKSQITAVFSGKSGIDGNVVDVIVTRDALSTNVARVVSVLRAAKAQSVNVKTTRRDGSTANLPLAWGVARPECAAVAMIGKDNSISAWTVGGGTAARFAKGFAGPDLTLGSAGVRKLTASCDATVFYLSAADNIAWGLAFDLALAVRGGEDGGAPARAISTTLLAEAPVPGRKVDRE